MDILSLFLEGLLSFFSPCVLPLIPLYMSYLSSDYRSKDENGKIVYKTSKVFIMTIFFVLGISLVFLLLALSVNLIKPFIEKYQEIIGIIGGTLIIIFGLHETGLININVLNVTKRLDAKYDVNDMNYFKAFLLGFLFSFAWTPCIGPLLGSAIIIASSSSLGSIYILIYGLGLVIPFLITGLFTSKVLEFISKKENIFKYVMVIAGIILIIYGCYMIVTNAKTITSLKNNQTTSSSETTDENIISLPTNTFYDQNDNEILFKNYKDKYVFINFITTWCTYCKSEIPAYIEFCKNNDEVACVYIMSTNTSGVNKETIKEFIKENNIDIPVIIDENEVMYSLCNINAYPTLYVANKDLEILGYISSALSLDNFNQLLTNLKEN